MAAQTIDDKINAVLAQISTLKARNIQIDADIAHNTQAYKDYAAQNDWTNAYKYTDQNNIETEEKAANLTTLKTLEDPDTGALALLQTQKQIQQQAQQAIVDQAKASTASILSPAQQLQLAQINAVSNSTKPTSSNTTMYVIIGVVIVVIAIGVFAYFKIKK